MSGTGSPSGPPSFLTPVAPSEPIGRDGEGKPVYGEFWFMQMIQRILSFLGQPTAPTGAGSVGGGGLTVAEQISSIQEQVTTLTASGDQGAVGLMGRVAALEALERASRFRPAASTKRGPSALPFPVTRAVRTWLPAAPPAGITLNIPVAWLAGQNPNNLVLFTAAAPGFVTSIGGRLEIAEGAAATLSIVKAASGTALSAGTLLHTGSFNANGTPATNQTLTLAAFATVALAAGDSIGVQTTGTWTTSSGALSIGLKA